MKKLTRNFWILIGFVQCASIAAAQDAAEPFSAFDVLKKGGGVRLIEKVLSDNSIPLNDCIFLALVFQRDPNDGSILIIRREVESYSGEGIMPSPKKKAYSVMSSKIRTATLSAQHIKKEAVLEFAEEASFLLRNQKTNAQNMNLLDMRGLEDEEHMIFFAVQVMNGDFHMETMMGGKLVRPKPNSKSGDLMSMVKRMTKNIESTNKE